MRFTADYILTTIVGLAVTGYVLLTLGPGIARLFTHLAAAVHAALRVP